MNRASSAKLLFIYTVYAKKLFFQLAIFILLTILIIGNISSIQNTQLQKHLTDMFVNPQRYIKENDSNYGEKCSEPKMSVAFAKTHRTGSTTLQNILLRFGVKHDLVFAFPDQSWMFQLDETFKADQVLDGNWKILNFNIFASHSLWSYSEVKKVIPRATFITILRDPVECFESNFVFMGLEKQMKKDINEFAEEFAAENVPRRKNEHVGQNQLLWDLGMNIDDMANVTAVQNKIMEFDQQFDLVLITEHYQESLIIMQDLLCWQIKDIVYFKQLERINSKKSKITEKSREILKKWLWADYLLYDHFAEKLKRHILIFGEAKMNLYRKQLLLHINEITMQCIKKKTEIVPVENQINDIMSYEVDMTRPWCQPYVRKETDFSYMIRQYQNLKVNELKKLQGLT